MEVGRAEMMEQDAKKYSIQYDKMHIETMEQKIREKDKLLFELSSINQELYQELNDLQSLLALSKQERDLLLQENIGLKDKLMEKMTFITQQETVISRLRSNLSEKTNGNSFLIEERSFNGVTRDYLINQVRQLQQKYDSREDLVITLQDERVKLLTEIDKFRLNHFDARLIVDKPKDESFTVGSYERECQRVVEEICKVLGCSKIQESLGMIIQMADEIKAYCNTVAKVKRYFHLNSSTTLSELDRYVVNLIM
jgi:hypothetical protein